MGVVLFYQILVVEINVTGQNRSHEARKQFICVARAVISKNRQPNAILPVM